MSRDIVPAYRTLRCVLIDLAAAFRTPGGLRGFIPRVIGAVRLIRVLIVTQIVGVLKFNHPRCIPCSRTIVNVASRLEFLHLNSPSQNKKAAWHHTTIRQGGRM